MKPVFLEIEAFGPYCDVQKIDFSLLKDKNMFLIHGSTGGGKTTILDAICYALYGDTSGKERDPESMRSHFAKEDQLTQVKFTFKVGQETYYIHRIPGQDRPKKVGTGLTYQNPEVELYQVNDGKHDLLASNITMARDKIVEIIGFDSDQFRQVIMIPQGQFRKLLVAKSEDRQKILGEIFQTGKYKQVEDKIREEERTLRNEVASLKERRTEQIKNIKYEPDSLLETLILKEHTDAEGIMAEVKHVSVIQEEAINKIADEMRVLDSTLKNLSIQITQATQDHDKYKEKEKAKVKYKDLVGQENVYIEKERLYRQGQKALPLKTKEEYVTELASQKEKLQKDIDTIKGEIVSANETYKQITKEVNECKNQEVETNKLEIQLNKAVEEYRPKLIELIDLNKQAKLAQEAAGQIKKEKDQLEKQKTVVIEEVGLAEKALEQRQALNDNLRKEEVEIEKLSVVLKQKKQLVKLEEDHKDLREEYKKIDSQFKKAQETYVKETDIHSQTLNLWIKGQAGELARNLQDNQPCPVCGSTAHPHIAKVISGMPTKAELEEKKKALDQAHEDYLRIQNNHTKITTKGKENKKEIDRQKELMADYANILLEDMENKHRKLQEVNIKTKKSLQILDRHQEKMVKQKEQMGQIDQTLLVLQDKEKVSADTLVTLNTQVGQIQIDIPKELQSKEKLDGYIKETKDIIRTQKEYYEQIKQRLEELTKQKIGLETSEKEKIAQLEDIDKKYEIGSRDLKDKITLAGFESFLHYTQAYQSQSELENLDEEIKTYRNLYSGLKAQYKKLEEETKDIVLLDLLKLNQDYEGLEKDKDELARKQQTIMLEKQHNDKQVDIISETSQTINDKENRYRIVGSLYKAARGSNVKGLSFERFIQSSLFEDVLIRANERLVLMSNNRYELYRSDNRDTMASQSGLDLEVLDTYTGKKRHVRTLSGGEGFMASLSLALGLADVVQSYAGGISLDTIFIDEGFGTLDTEALDAAIKTLIDLQQSGRLVGIISHVPELKERIGARLEVVGSQKGSKVKFHI